MAEAKEGRTPLGGHRKESHGQDPRDIHRAGDF